MGLVSSIFRQRGKVFGLRMGAHLMTARALGVFSMPTEVRQLAPTHCGRLMRLVAIEPSPSVRGYDEITYHCGNCNYKEKHVRKAENLRN